MSSPETPPTAGRSRLIAIIAGSAVGFLVLCGGAFAAGYASAPAPTAAPLSSSASTDAAVAPRPQPSVMPTATDIRTCSVTSFAKDAALDVFAGTVTDTSTSEVLYSKGKAASPGGAQLLVTAATVLDVLKPDYTLQTKVVAGTTPGTIVLVGGGDPTLSSVASGSSVYPNAPTLSDLASQVTSSLDTTTTPITSIVLDASLWSTADAWDSTWPKSLRTSGYLSPVTALQVDGDRSDPAKQISPRSKDPVMAAGKAFAAALGVPDAALSLGTAEAGASELASVESEPVSSLVNTMLLTGDATLAETLARVASRVQGNDGSRASLQATMSTALADTGVEASGQVFYDASGTSASNAETTEFIAGLLQSVKAGAGDLAIVYNSLSVPGDTGTLETRFADDTTAAAGAALHGLATARTGERTLSGLLDAQDGTSLSFAFTATSSDVGKKADAAFDALAAAVYACGGNLSSR